MDRKVTYARLHAALFIQGIGNLEAVLPSPSRTLKGFSMTARSAGIEVTMNGQNVLVPWANVQVAVLGEEEPKTPALKTAA